MDLILSSLDKGFWGFVATIIVVVAFSQPVKEGFLKLFGVLTNGATHLLQKKIGGVNMKEHYLFDWIGMMLNYRLDQLVFHDTNPIRDAITRDFLKIKLASHNNTFLELIDKDFGSMIELRDAVYEAIKKNAVEYRQEAINQGIPIKFLDKYEVVRKTKEINFFEDVDMVCRSSVFPTTVETLSGVLGTLQFYFRLSIMEAEITIAMINGELNDEVYKGEKVGPGEKKNWTS